MPRSTMPRTRIEQATEALATRATIVVAAVSD
jgi:hypothetical protein